MTSTTSKPRYLTKSRFKLGIECPAKLFYTGKENIYANRQLADSFFKSLADEGRQVEALAKQYIPGGREIDSIDYEQAVKQTSKYLERGDVVIYEAAFRFNNLFIRTDILVKKGSQIDLIEVKAKSYDPAEDDNFISSHGEVKAKWREYIFDVAFQKYVVTKSIPEASVNAFLMLVDKTRPCPTIGLSGKIATASFTEIEKKEQILVRVKVDDACQIIENENVIDPVGPKTFFERIEWMADHYERDELIRCLPASRCASCEFQSESDDQEKGLKSGFKECWKRELKWTDLDFESPTIFKIWNFKGKDQLVAESRFKISDITKDDIKPIPDGRPGISISERQWLQVEKSQNKDELIWIDRAGLKAEMKKWEFPVHFIDFETIQPAIPFHKGRRPYELIAFQFSHHIVYSNGQVAHKGEFLNTTTGFFPNYDFIRSLKDQLTQDNGTIFCYATHENTTLLSIQQQLTRDTNTIPDKAELQSFIKSITTISKKSCGNYISKRPMVDMLELVKRYYYAPATNGSNSIKQVLPAVLASSGFLQEKYSKPIYGTEGGIRSHNFKDKAWVQKTKDNFTNPYKQLPKIFENMPDGDFNKISGNNEISEGGAAMTAYAKMQFTEIGTEQRMKLEKALRRYCELDTLAMVMIYEAWVKDVNI